MPSVGQGGTIRLDGVFTDGTGSLVDPVNPLVDIFNPAGIEVLTDAIPVRDSVGRFHHNYAVAIAAPLGTWRAHWTGTINGVPVQGEDYFVVVAAGSIDFDTSWTPAPADIKAVIPQRLQGRPFALDTIPTIAQVEAIAAGVVIDIKTFVGEEIVEADMPLAKLAATIEAAAEVERALYPEQAAREGSTYQLLHEEYLELRKRLAEITGDRQSAEDKAGGPAFSFPVPSEVPTEVYQPLGQRRW